MTEPLILNLAEANRQVLQWVLCPLVWGASAAHSGFHNPYTALGLFHS